MGIFGGGSDAPSPPNPKKLIQLQEQANLDVARTNAQLNRVNQITPYGDVTYSNKGDQYTQTTTLPADAQAALEHSQAIANQLSGVGLNDLVPQISSTYATPFNGDFSTYSDKATNDILSRLNPQIDQDRQHAIALLAARGITPETNLDAYNKELDQFNRQANDARTQAELQGFNVGQQYYQNAITSRELPYNELAALLGSSQVQSPNALPVGQANVANTDVAGIYNQAYQNALTAQLNQNQGLGNILGLAGTIGGSIFGGPIGGALGGALGSALGGSGSSSGGLGSIGTLANPYASGATASFFGF